VAHGPAPEEIAEAKATADAAGARLQRTRASTRPEQRRQAQAELDSALADQLQADADFTRAQRLLPQGAVSRADYDTGLAPRERAHQRVAVLQAALEMLEQGSRSEEIAEAEAALRETVVTASEHCLIVEVTVRPGSVVAAGHAVVVAR